MKNNKCFKANCNKESTHVLKNFWLGFSFIPIFVACDEHTEMIRESVRMVEIEKLENDKQL